MMEYDGIRFHFTALNLPAHCIILHSVWVRQNTMAYDGQVFEYSGDVRYVLNSKSSADCTVTVCMAHNGIQWHTMVFVFECSGVYNLYVTYGSRWNTMVYDGLQTPILSVQRSPISIRHLTSNAAPTQVYLSIHDWSEWFRGVASTWSLGWRNHQLRSCNSLGKFYCNTTSIYFQLGLILS